MPDGSATAHVYRPKLATVFSEGYGFDPFRKDAVAALTVAIVALPLSMAIAVASGVSPERGLYTAIIGGFLVSALGGSRFQVGGPAGAFIVVVAATVAKFGVEGLLLTVLLSGLMLTLIGLSRLGSLIRFIPHAVAVGFTCGIAVTILASQLKDIGGLTLPGVEPGPFFPKLAMIGQALPTLSPAAFSVGAGSAALIFAQRRWRPTWPGMLIAVVSASIATLLLRLPIETIGSHFGGVPHGLLMPKLPPVTASRLLEILPAALSFTLLGGVESLLSAKVADGMTGRKHRYNMELVAQGIANMASALFGGIQRHGNDRAHRHQHPGRGAKPCRRNDACRLPSDLHACGSAVGEFHPTLSARGSPGGGLLEHGRKEGVSGPASRLAYGISVDRNLWAHACGEFDRRHHSRMSACRCFCDL